MPTKWEIRPRIPCSVCGGPTGWSISAAGRAGENPRCRLCTRAKCGTTAAYSRGCRCDLCRSAKAAAMRAYAAAYRERNGRGLWGNYRKPTTARHGNAVPRRVRLAIYERDGWVCQLCGDPVDRALHPNHRWAASLDHVECQSWVLIPDHSPANLRLVHRACNSRRRDRAGVTAA